MLAAIVPPSDRLASAPAFRALLLLAALCLAFSSVRHHQQQLGLEYLRTEQMERLAAVVHGTAPNPWQYRVLTDNVAYYAVQGVATLQPGSDPALTLFAFRLLQQVAVLLALFALYRTLGLSRTASLAGLTIYTYATYQATYNSDLSLNTHADVLLYALFCIGLLRERFAWAFVVGALAALNRETSGLMAGLAILPVAIRAIETRRLPTLPELRASPHVRLAIGLLAVWAAAYFGLRGWYGMRPWSVWNMPPSGLPTLLANLSIDTLVQLFKTVTLLPLAVFAALASRRYDFPALAGILFLAVWFPVHFAIAWAIETRLFLVPTAIAFVPATLLLFARDAPSGRPAAPR